MTKAREFSTIDMSGTFLVERIGQDDGQDPDIGRWEDVDATPDPCLRVALTRFPVDTQ